MVNSLHLFALSLSKGSSPPTSRLRLGTLRQAQGERRFCRLTGFSVA